MKKILFFWVISIFVLSGLLGQNKILPFEPESYQTIHSIKTKQDRHGLLWTICEERRHDHSLIQFGPKMDKLNAVVSKEGFNVLPDFSFDQNNNPWIVWVNYSDGNYSIFVKDFQSSLVWKISTPFFSSVISPKIVVDHNNHVWVFWSGIESGERGIFYRNFNRLSWSEISVIKQGNNYPYILPEACVDSQGLIWLSWNGYDGMDYKLCVTCWNGRVWSEIEKISKREPARKDKHLMIPLDMNKFMGFGDSITQGRFGYGEDPELGYIPRLEKLLNQYYLELQTVDNEGISGELTIEGLRRIEDAVKTHQAKYILIMEGTNDIDIDLGLQTDDIAFHLKEMIHRCKKLGAFPIISTILPQKGWAWELQEDRIRALNERIPQIANEMSVPYIDLFIVFNNYPDDDGGKEGLLSDLVHPNEKGYQLMAEKWYESIVNSVSSVLSFDANKVLNRSLFFLEYINVLSWQVNPYLKDVGNYRLFFIDGGKKFYITDLTNKVFEYLHRNLARNKVYNYALTTVDSEGKEGKPAIIISK